MHLTHSSSMRSTKEESYDGRRSHKGRVSFAGEDTTIHAQPLNTRDRHATMPPMITLYVNRTRLPLEALCTEVCMPRKAVAQNNFPR